MKLTFVTRLSLLCLTSLTLGTLFIAPALAGRARFFGPAFGELLNSDDPDKAIRLAAVAVVVFIIIAGLTFLAVKRKRSPK